MTDNNNLLNNKFKKSRIGGRPIDENICVDHVYDIESLYQDDLMNESKGNNIAKDINDKKRVIKLKSSFLSDKLENSDKSSIFCNNIEKTVEKYLIQITKIQSEYLEKTSRLPQECKKEDLREFGIKFSENSLSLDGQKNLYKEDIWKLLKDNYDKCYKHMIKTNEELSMDLVIKWHTIAFKLYPLETLVAGKMRQTNYIVSSSYFVPPSPKKIAPCLKELFYWYNQNKDKLNPVLIACLMSFRFFYIHPFEDGNGRISRLIMNYVLYKNRYPMFNIPCSNEYDNMKKKALQNSEEIYVKWFLVKYIKQWEKKSFFCPKSVNFLKINFK